MEFKPSEIAAAVAISFAVKVETVESEKALSALVDQHVQKVNMAVQIAQHKHISTILIILALFYLDHFHVDELITTLKFPTLLWFAG